MELREKRTGGVMDGTAHDSRGETLSSDVLKETVENKARKCGTCHLVMSSRVTAVFLYHPMQL